MGAMGKALAANMINFIDQSPTPFHVVVNVINMLKEASFQEVCMDEDWQLLPKGKYFVTRGKTAIIAFKLGSKDFRNSPMRMIGAHTDSPSLKLKSSPDVKSAGHNQLAVEVYGSPILSTWFDRDLSLAGKVVFVHASGELDSILIDFKRPIAIIPNVAIHMDRNHNDNRSINKQTEMVPILWQEAEENFNFSKLILNELKKSGIDATEILGHDLYFYDCQKSALLGVNEEYIVGARIDNLASCFTGLNALIEETSYDNNANYSTLVVFNDHEEVGSVSPEGADGNFLESVLKRIAATEDSYQKMMAKSFLISCDNAHALHPNYTNKHEPNHAPIMNKGPVIKINSNKRYATDGGGLALFKYWCKKEEIPVQQFCARSDMPCGSTIGPTTAARLGVRTLDVGIPTFGMHSIREVAGVWDIASMTSALKEFFEVNEIPEL